MAFILLCSGPLLVCALFLLWRQTGRIEEAFRLADRQLQISEDFQSFVQRLGVAPDRERRSILEFASEFDHSLDAIERNVAVTRWLLPGTSDLRGRLDEMRRLWEQVETPLIRVAASPVPEAQSAKGLEPRVSSLVRDWRIIVADVGNVRQTLHRWLIVTLAAISVLCLLILYGGAVVFRRYAARLAQLMNKAIERGQGGRYLNTTPLITEGELAGLPRPLRAVSASVGRLLGLIEQATRRTEGFVNRVPAGMLVLSADLRILYANHFFLAMRRLQSREIVGKSLREAFPSSTVSKWAANALESGIAPQNICVELDDQHGTRRLRVTLIPLRPGEDPVARLMLVVEDETELSGLRTAQEELEQRYQRLLQNVTEAIVRVDEDGFVAELNPAAERLFGYRRDEVLSKPLTLVMPEAAATAPEQRLGALLSSGKWRLHQTVVECEFLKKTGATFPAEVRLSSCRVDSRSYHMLSIQDVSAHRSSETLAHDRLEVIELIARNRPLENVLACLSQMLERQLPGSLCCVMLRRDDRLYIAAAPNMPESYLQTVDGMPIGPSVASCGTAAFKGKLIAVGDIATDPLWDDYRDLALRHNLRSSWSIPIHSSDGLVVGTIAIYCREPRHPETAQIELLQMASRLAAVSIEQRDMTGRLAFQAQHDALTGLPNRLSFEEHMKRAIVGARRHKRPVGLLSVDLDRFKLVNDTLGHAVGDGLLQEVARRIQQCVRETDIVARWGGDEFMIGLTELARAEDAGLVAQKVLDVFKRPLTSEGHELFITSTIGASVYPEDGADLAALVRNADRAMYRAKNQGRNNFRCYDPQDGEVAGPRLEMEFQLRHAVERGELTLQYQPLYELEGYKLAGLEALLRWKHPKLGSVAPTTFIPIAEETGLIIPIGAWVLQEVCRQLAEWQRAGYRPVRVAVNVSTLQFARRDFVDLVADTLAGIGVEPSLLELEMTESLVMRNVEESAVQMAKLRDLGVGIAIDDFGTGYSSLSCLQRLPIDTLKIDQSFVRDLTAKVSTLPLVQSVVSLARGLGMKATAEGVETESQLEALRATGCHLVQGFYLGRPLTANRVLPVIAEGRRRTTFVIKMPVPKEDSRSRKYRQSYTAPRPPQAVRQGTGDVSIV